MVLKFVLTNTIFLERSKILSVDNNIFYVENPNDLTKLLKLINKFNKVGK